MTDLKPSRLIQLIAGAELPIILAIAPLLLFPTPGRLIALGVVPVLWLSAWRTTGSLIPRTPLNVAIGLMLVMVGISLFVTPDILLSLGKVAGLSLDVLLFWAVCRWITTPSRLKIGVVVFVLAAGGLALLGLLGTDFVRLGLNTDYNPSKMPLLAAITMRLPPVIRGVPGAENGFNSNAVAGCLVLFVPLQVGLLASGAHHWLSRDPSERTRSRLLFALQAVLLFITGATTILMQSRGAWLGLAVAGFAFFVWQSWTTRLLAGVAALLLVIIASFPSPVTKGGQTPSARVLMLDYNFSSRFEFWSRGIRGIEDSPFAGLGMNMFRKVMPLRYPMATKPEEEVPHAHNHFLQAALDLGIPGLIAYAALWILTAVLLVHTYRQSNERIYRAIAGGLSGGFIAHFVFSITDVIPLGAKVGVLYWLALALTVALHRIAVRKPA